MNKLLIAALLATTAYHPARAEVTSVLPDNSKTAEVIVITGEIKYEDDKVLANVLSTIARKGHSVRGVVFDSEGGNVIAAAGMADLIHHNGYNTYVHEGSVCASACFLAWAAGKERYFRGNAQIGVHNVTIKGEENADAAKVTLVMIKCLKDYGVTAEILGKLASTSASDVAWLSPGELAQMGATYLPPMNAKPVTAQSKPIAPPAEGSGPQAKVNDVINWDGAWGDYVDQAGRWSAQSYGKINARKVDHKDGSYLLSLYYKSDTGKVIELTENHQGGTKEDFSAWTCVHYSNTLKHCRGWHAQNWDTYNKIADRWIKQ
jgi:hypothetical protein